MPNEYPIASDPQPTCALSVVIPVFNESMNLLELYSRLNTSISELNINYELLFINDGSKDESLVNIMHLAKLDSRVTYINLSRNFGHQIAVSAGLDYCKGAAAVIIDADLQDPPELIPSLYRKFKEGYNVVYAKRVHRQGEGFFKKVSAKLFYIFLHKISSIDIPVDVGDFRIIDRKIINYLNKMPEKNKFLRGQIAWLGFRQTSIEFHRSERKAGRSGYSLSKMIQLAMDAITGFSDKPLSFVTSLGFFISLFSFFIIVYALYAHFILQRTITGWTSLIISSMFIGGVQLISIGIIGEYISRMNRNIQNRPLYVIEDTNIESNTSN